jgi:hypothetical protein
MLCRVGSYGPPVGRESLRRRERYLQPDFVVVKPHPKSQANRDLSISCWG